MASVVKLRIKPEDFAREGYLDSLVSQSVSFPVAEWKIKRKSIDARQRQVWFELEILVAPTGESIGFNDEEIKLQKVRPDSPSIVIVGAGPAGLFAALRALELGMKPIVVERGKPVEERILDIANLQKNGILNADSNFCFGEGGAGAYSDGKLFTRSKKRGNVQEILQLLHFHGAPKEVLYEAHPHIGSDKLPGVIKNIRNSIINHGGEIHFSTKFDKLIIENGIVKGIITDTGQRFSGPVILATGHSSRDVYKYLDSVGVRVEPKGFAMGVRLEHPQHLIDRMVYHSDEGRGKYLPPAEYSVSCQVDGRGVYSFCMCPGGVIVPSASSPGESVVNGMSASGRSGRWANSGLVVELHPEDFPEYQKKGNLGMLELQEEVEKRFFEESQSYNAPAQRMRDFVDGKLSKHLPSTSFVPGIHSADLSRLLPSFISDRLKKGFIIMGRKNKGFLTNEAVMIGLESRTSSPVRIPRDKELLHHPDFPGLYPVGEGAGFSGGIVSSAIDGRRAVDAVFQTINKVDIE